MKKVAKDTAAFDKAKRRIKKIGGTVRTAEAVRAGIHPRTLYELRDAGDLEQVSRGVFRLSEQEPLSNPDLVTVALRVPRAVVCLVSALSFHGITTQIPHSVAIALEPGSESPRIHYPPVTVHRFSGAALTAGIEEHKIDGVQVRFYSPEKTLADCFKYRNKIGMDVVLEALTLYKARKKLKLSELLEHARACRVEKIMKPYLEAML